MIEIMVGSLYYLDIFEMTEAEKMDHMLKALEANGMLPPYEEIYSENSWLDEDHEEMLKKGEDK